MARKKTRKRKVAGRSGAGAWLRRWLLRCMGLGVLALGAWIFYLDYTVTRQFEGRRWTLPAQVYAQPLDLYAGLSLSIDELEAELQRLGYQAVERPQRPGTYRRDGNRIDLAARRAEFWDEVREPQAISLLANQQSIERIFDGRGQDVAVFRLDPLLIGSIFPIHGEDRMVLTPEEIPPLLPAALKVVEDRKFDSHFGVDPLGIARAVVVNLRAGQVRQGASTLTQQLVRSYFLHNRRTWSRKIEEALMSIILDARFDKQDIMNAYINEIFLGQDGGRAVHGFGLASVFYFGKPLTELELHEIATLVAVVRGPSFYDPRRRPEQVLARRDLVLDLMAEFQIAPGQEVANAKTQALGISANARQAAGYHPAFLDVVRRSLRRDYREADLTEAGLKIFTTLDPRVQDLAEKTLVAELQALEKGHSQAEGASPLEGAVVITSPQNGEVIAMVGGRRVGFSGFNRALDARRPMGSLVKPVVYLAALESGRFHAGSLVQDAPVRLDMPNGDVWAPRNFSNDFAGPVPLARALAESLNLATVNLGLDVGLENITPLFPRLGLERQPSPLPSMLLGAVDASPMEVAQVYSSLANGGFHTPLRAVHAVVNEQGERLRAYPLEVSQVADAGAVYQVNQMMVQAMERGTGRAWRARLPSNLTVAGKTGTSSDNRDSWFAGFSGSHLGVVWIGHDDNRPTGLTGSSGALPVWARMMAQMETRPWRVSLPAGVEEAWVDLESGRLSQQGCTPATVLLALPENTDLPGYPGCAPSRLRDMGDKARSWIRGVFQ